ncbi:MAG: dienelactone hydrolase family protein [Microscillaceae bacterium]
MFVADFSFFQHQHENITHPVYFRGEGPPVIVMHELPGMVPECLAFAERLEEAGFRVYLPLFFGKPGQNPAFIVPFLTVCIRREFSIFARKQTSPVVNWLRSLCQRLYAEHGGKGVGAIGMCMTGGFAIPMMVEPSLVAPVLSQPATPPNLGKSYQTAFGCSDEDLAHAHHRVKTENIPIKAYRFSQDKLVPRARMEAYQAYFGEYFQYQELDCARQKPYGKGCHSVFTLDYVDEPGHPTHEALQDLIEYLKKQLV